MKVKTEKDEGHMKMKQMLKGHDIALHQTVQKLEKQLETLVTRNQMLKMKSFELREFQEQELVVAKVNSEMKEQLLFEQQTNENLEREFTQRQSAFVTQLID